MDGCATADRADDPRAGRRLPDAAQPQLLVDVRRHPDLHARRADRHRHRARHALPAERRSCLRFRRTHPPRRELRLAAPQPARGRRLDVLPRRLRPYLPRPLLRLLQGAARDPVDHRRVHLRRDDGNGVHGLLASLGPDELLGRHRHHQPLLLARQHLEGAWHHHRRVAVGRLLGVGRDAQPFLQPALSSALRDRRPRRPAPLGTARRRPEQPDGPRHQDRIGFRAVHAVRDLQGRGRHVRLPPALLLVRVLPAGLPGPRRQLHAGEPAGDAAAHRARMVLPAVLRDPARHPVEAVRRHRHVLGDHRAAVRALARHQPRALDQVSPAVSLVLLAVRLQRRGARLARLQAAGCRVRVLGARLHDLLLRALPGRDAARRLARDAAEGAGLDHRGGARPSTERETGAAKA